MWVKTEESSPECDRRKLTWIFMGVCWHLEKKKEISHEPKPSSLKYKTAVTESNVYTS